MQKTQQFRRNARPLLDAVAPIAASQLDAKWIDLGDGYIQGTWHEDGSPYTIKCPPQLVPALLAAQKICSAVRSRYENQSAQLRELRRLRAENRKMRTATIRARAFMRSIAEYIDSEGSRPRGARRHYANLLCEYANDRLFPTP